MRPFFYTILLIINFVILTMIKRENDSLFWMLTGELLVFNLIEIVLLKRSRAPYFFINPMLFVAFIVFFLTSGGITNFFMTEAGEFQIKGITTMLPRHPEWINRFMVYANIGAIMMWAGYHTNVATKFSLFMRNIGYKKWWNGEINITRLWVIVIFGYLIKLYLFSIGLHGRLIDEEYFEQGAGYKLGSQIRILGEMSLLTFIFVAYLFFKSKGQSHRLMFFGALALELFFAFLSGARAPFLFPFIIIFFVYYYLNQRIKLSMIFLVIIPILISFTYVASFKTFVLSRAFERSGNPIEVLADYQKFMSQLDTKSKENVTGDLQDKIIESTNFVCEGAAAIWYKDTKGLDAKSPDFILWLLKSPVDAFIPLFLQPVKNIPAYGLWFKNEVLRINKGLYYSIATSHVGYFYLTGGFIVVIIGFFVFGIIVKIIYNLLFEGVVALAIFIMCFSFLFGSDIFSTLIVYFFRTMFLYPILVWILYAKWGLVWKKQTQPKLSPTSI